MENNLPKSGDAIDSNKTGKIAYNPDAIFKDKTVSYFGGKETIKTQYQEFTGVTGKKKWINSTIIVIVFLLIEAIIIANNTPTRDFVCEFFSIKI